MFSLISVRSLTDTLRFILLGFLGFNALSCILTCFLSTAWRSKGSLVTIDSAEPRCSHSGSYECRERKGNTVSIRSLKSIVHVKIRQVFRISLKAVAICSLAKCPRPWVLSSILCPVTRQQCNVMHTVSIVGLIYTVQLQYTLIKPYQCKWFWEVWRQWWIYAWYAWQLRGFTFSKMTKCYFRSSSQCYQLCI